MWLKIFIGIIGVFFCACDREHEEMRQEMEQIAEQGQQTSKQAG